MSDLERLSACRRVYARLPRDLQYWVALIDMHIDEAVREREEGHDLAPALPLPPDEPEA